MKKRMVAALLAFSCCFAVACGGDKKGAKNEEFEEYSSQVLSVMQDIGLVTDLPESSADKTKTAAKR